jgi:archaellum biogenesis protein FlaJ (TadC family)
MDQNELLTYIRGIIDLEKEYKTDLQGAIKLISDKIEEYYG